MSACSYGKKSFKGSECGSISKGSKVRSNISDKTSEHSFTIREYNSTSSPNMMKKGPSSMAS